MNECSQGRVFLGDAFCRCWMSKGDWDGYAEMQ